MGEIWFFEIINTMGMGILAVLALFGYFLSKCNSCCKNFLDCILTLTCVKPILMFLFYTSLCGFFGTAGYMSWYWYKHHDLIHELRSESNHVWEILVVQIVSAVFVLVITFCHGLNTCYNKCCNNNYEQEQRKRQREKDRREEQRLPLYNNNNRTHVNYV